MSTTLNEAERWRLRAEEYRAIAGRMNDRGCRATLEDIANTYDAMASLENRPTRSLTPELCRAHALECAEFVRRVSTERGRLAVHDVRERWLALAHTQRTQGLEVQPQP